MQAILALEDGRIFRGEGYGAQGECRGEVVFNTSLTGYQEIFTDPSYAGQIVVLTNPQIGNYGTNSADNEAARPYIEGLVTREFSPISSNWRSQQVADEYLERFHVPVISEIDTRALVRHLRTYGVMRGVISTVETDPHVLIEKARSIPKMDGTDLASVVSTKDSYEFEHDGPDPLHPDESPSTERPSLHVVAYDYGIKKNILRMLVDEGCRVTVVPAQTSAEDVLALKPDGVFLSNGPGDPSPSPTRRTISAASPAAPPSLGFVWVTSSSASLSVAKRTSSNSAIMAATIRSGATIPARSKSPATITTSLSIPTRSTPPRSNLPIST